MYGASIDRLIVATNKMIFFIGLSVLTSAKFELTKLSPSTYWFPQILNDIYMIYLQDPSAVSEFMQHSGENL